MTCAQKIIEPKARGGRETTLSPEVKPRLDEQYTGYASYHRDDEWQRQVVHQFEDAMNCMLRDLRASHVGFFHEATPRVRGELLNS